MSNTLFWSVTTLLACLSAINHLEIIRLRRSQRAMQPTQKSATKDASPRGLRVPGRAANSLPIAIYPANYPLTTNGFDDVRQDEIGPTQDSRAGSGRS